MVNAAPHKDDAASRATVARALGRALFACLKSDRPDGLVPTVVADPADRVLGLVYSSAESVAEALARDAGVYFSRSRNALWVKGETSGDTQVWGIRILILILILILDFDFDL
jgi:phosphoribosyl-AMP cyclohydrolase